MGTVGGGGDARSARAHSSRDTSHHKEGKGAGCRSDAKHTYGNAQLYVGQPMAIVDNSVGDGCRVASVGVNRQIPCKTALTPK